MLPSSSSYVHTDQVLVKNEITGRSLLNKLNVFQTQLSKFVSISNVFRKSLILNLELALPLMSLIARKIKFCCLIAVLLEYLFCFGSEVMLLYEVFEML